jgi:hypothetical protein
MAMRAREVELNAPRKIAFDDRHLRSGRTGSSGFCSEAPAHAASRNPKRRDSHDLRA